MEFRYELIKAVKDPRRLAALLDTIAEFCGNEAVAKHIRLAKSALEANDGTA